MSQPWAGKNWGAINIPRIGQEVIVEFLEGDPDRPIITGRVYNDEQMPPYTLPDDMTRTTFLTRSRQGRWIEQLQRASLRRQKGRRANFHERRKGYGSSRRT